MSNNKINSDKDMISERNKIKDHIDPQILNSNNDLIQVDTENENPYISMSASLCKVLENRFFRTTNQKVVGSNPAGLTGWKP